MSDVGTEFVVAMKIVTTVILEMAMDAPATALLRKIMCALGAI